MLSTMKQKISKELSSGSGSVEPSLGKQDTAASVTTQTVVSHIPPAKVSVAGTPSAESSLASLEYHAFAPLSRNIDSETFEGSGPPLSIVRHSAPDSATDESSRAERIFDAPANLTKCHSRIFENVETPLAVAPSSCLNPRKRTVSITTPEVHEGTSVKASSSKKPRLHQNAAVSGLQPLAPLPVAMRLLAHSMDKQVLNPLHSFVRQQIECFTATQSDMAQPAPGRKNPIQLHQVGLRCIHCRDLPPKDRVKRAVCYPSSVGRVYHSVSDMKFDHFGACKGIPAETKAKLMQLKVESKTKREKKSSTKATGCSSSTAQYYHDSARQLGMVDSQGGVFLNGQSSGSQRPSPGEQVTARKSLPAPVYSQGPSSKATPSAPVPTSTSDHSRIPTSLASISSSNILNALPAFAPNQEYYQNRVVPQSLAPLIFSLGTNPAHPFSRGMPSVPRTGALMLSSLEDQCSLNPLHCFVRRHVEVFAANKDDISAPAPGRKTRVLLGQVGIRCVHCASLAPKERVKRAVCYPPSVSGLYHCVSNMKFDHFAICRGLSAADRTEFVTLRARSGRRALPQGATKDSSNSTAQYYKDSAVRLGLVDTLEGIRFRESMVPLVEKALSIASIVGAKKDVVPDGISALMIAATDPEVRAAYLVRHHQV